MTRFNIIVGGAIDTTPEQAEQLAQILATILISNGATHTQARINPVDGEQGASK